VYGFPRDTPPQQMSGLNLHKANYELLQGLQQAKSAGAEVIIVALISVVIEIDLTRLSLHRWAMM
jgi:hypothetical protein